MSGRSIAIGAAAIALLAAGIALAIAVRSEAEPARVEAEAAKPAPKAGSNAQSAAAPRIEAARTTGPYKNFTSPEGNSVKPSDPATRYPIPDGGFANWTGREGTSPGDMEGFAKDAGLRLPVALEQHRSTLLEERTADTKLLAQLLGEPPTGQMLATIANQAGLMHEASAKAQVAVRDGSMSDDASIRATRDAEDAYRHAYLSATGLSEQQFDRFFSPDHPFPF